MQDEARLRLTQLLGGQLKVSVTDDGVGFSDTPGNGMGLTNIRDRLAMLYGDKAELLMEENPDGGAKATICLPMALE